MATCAFTTILTTLILHAWSAPASVPAPDTEAQSDAPESAAAAPAEEAAAPAVTPASPQTPPTELGDTESTAEPTEPATPARAPAVRVESEAGTASEPTQEADTDPANESAPESENQLVPKHERVLLADHDVALDKAKFQVGKGLVFVSKNGRFKLATRLRAQFLYGFSHDGEEATHGFQIRRARLQFGGHLFSEHIKFKTEFAFSPRDSGFNGSPRNTPILDWYVEIDYLRDLTVRIGQYKLPYSRQRVVSSGDLQLVDRALAQGEFNLDRDIGIDLRSADIGGIDKLRYYAGVYFGEGRDQFENTNFDLMYLGRFEVLPFGSFEDYEEADFERSRKPRLSLGAAYAFIDGAQRNRGILGSTPSDGGTTDYHNVTADFVFKIVGLSLTGEFFYRQGNREFGDATIVDEDTGVEMPAPLEQARTGLGWFAQGGYLIPRIPLEFAARYSQVRGLGTSTSLGDIDEVGGGVSYYFAHHPLKLQADYFHIWNDGVLADGVDQVRLQLQVGF